MAYDFPRLEEYAPRLDIAPRKAVASEPPKRKYDSLSADEKAKVDRGIQLQLAQEDLAAKPRGALSEVATGLKRGAMVELPRLAGGALKATGGPGDLWYERGKRMVEAAETREPEYAADTLSGTHGAVTNAFAEGAAMLAPSVALMLGLPLLAAAGVPAGAAALGVGAAGGLMYGASKFQETYEKATEKGKSPDEAFSLGLQTGAVEGLGETVGGAVLGRVLSAGRAFPRILGKKHDIPEALAGIRDPKFLKQFAQEMGKVGAVETATEMGQGAGEAAIEHNAGIDETTPWNAATGVIGPTLALTALLGPLAALGVKSAQKRNKQLLDVVESPDTSFDATSRAARELAPTMEPLVGKEATAQWRMDTLVRANQLESGKALMGRDQQEKMMADAEANPSLEARQPQIGNVPGITPKAPQYASDEDAQALWDGFANTAGEFSRRVQDAESEARQQAAFAALVSAPLPPGVPSFTDYAKAVKAEAATDADPPEITLKGLQLGYIQKINQAIAGQNTDQPSGITPAEAAQPQLDLTHTNPEPASASVIPAVNEAAPGPNALQAALAGAQRDLDYGKAEAARDAQTAKQRTTDEGRLADVAKTTRRVEAANKFADAALAGKINGNTPVAYEDLEKAWRGVSKEVGIDISVLKGANLALMKSVLRTASEKKLWVSQLGSLRKARDAMTKGTVRRDTLAALIDRLENFNGQSTAAVSEEQQNTGQGNAQAATVRQDEGSSQGGQGSPAAVPEVKDEVAPAAPTKAEVVAPPTNGQVVTAAAPVAKATPATPPAPAKAPVAAAPTKTKARKGVIVSSTGAQKDAPAGTPVPWGDFSRNVDGTFSYDTTPSTTSIATGGLPVQRQTPETRAAVAKANQRVQHVRKGRAEVVQDVSQRKAREDARYEFEWYHYNPEISPVDGTNQVWLSSYVEAQKDALGFNASGKRTQESMKRALNARAALTWLHDYEGQYDWNAWEKEQRRQAILTTNARMRDIARGYMKSIEANVREGMVRKLLMGKNGEVPSQEQIDAYVLTPAQEKEVMRIARDDPGMIYLSTVEPKFQQTDELTAAINAGDTKAALTAIKQQGTEWMQQLADRLMELPTKITMIPEIGYSESGVRKFASYNHGTDTVTVYLGGDTPQTLLHELTHAASVGRIAFAKVALKLPENQRTAEHQAAIVALRDLQAFIDKVRAADVSNRFSYAHSNRKNVEEEFVAEVMSNEDLQDWLRSRGEGKSLLTRFMDWLRDLLGRPMMEAVSWQQAIDLSEPFITNSRFASTQGLSFDHSASGAMSQANATLGSIVKKAEYVAARSSFLGTAMGKMRSGFLHVATTFHVGQWIDKVPALRPLVDGMHKYNSADTTKRVLLQTKQSEFNTVATGMKLALAKLPTKTARDRMEHDVMLFAGDMSMMNIDLNKDYAGNLKNNSKLDPALKDYINRRHAEYMRLPAEFKKPLEDSIRVYRKNYIQHTAMVLRDTLGLYVKDSPQLAPYITALDIRGSALDQGTNPDTSFFFDAYSANLDKMIFKVLGEAKQASFGDDHLRADLAEIETFYNAARANPYMHLGRSGDHFLEFNVADVPGAWEAVQALMPSYGKGVGAPTKNRHIFMRFENPAQRDELEKKLNAMATIIEPGTVRNGHLLNLDSMLSMQGVPRAIQRLIKKADEDFDGPEKAEIRDYLKRSYYDMLPDSSAQKALVQRKDGGVPGYDANFTRNFAKRAAGMATMISNQYTLPLYDEAFDSMKTEVNAMRSAGDAGAQTQASEVLAEMGKRFSNSISPVDSPLIDKTKAFGFNYYLAFSPAFWLTNTTQPYTLTLPWIGARYGFVATAKEMGKSTSKGMKLITAAIEAGWMEGKTVGGMRGALLGVLDLNLPLDKTGLSPSEVAFVKRLVESGQLDTTQGHELGRDAAGDSRGFTTAMKVLSTGSHYTEVLNRLTAGLTAFNMAQRKGGLNTERSTQYAVDTVRGTQYDYSDQNTGRAFGRHGVLGPITPLITSFQNYTFQTMELLTRLAVDSVAKVPVNGTPEQVEAAKQERRVARKALGGVMVTTSMMAGTLGLPMATAISALANALLGDDDDPADVQSAYRLWLSEAFGKDVGELVARGAPRALLGIDTSSRAGLQDLLPGSRFFADRRDFKDRIEGGALNLLGPAMSAGASVATGLGHMADGQMMDGLIEFLPLALKGPLKAVKMGELGYTTSTGVKLPMEVTTWDEVVQTLGFTPSAKAEQSEVNFASRQRDALIKQRKTLLANKLYRAIENKEDPTALQQEVMIFNSQNPQYKIDVAAGLAARAKARSTAALSEAGIATQPRYLPQLDRYKYANV